MSYNTPLKNANDIPLDASGFSGNLDSSVDEVQKLGAAVDNLSLGGAVYFTNPVVDTASTDVIIGRYQLASGSSRGATTNEMELLPFWVGKGFTATSIECKVAVGAAGAVGRMGLYSDDDGKPGSLFLDAGTFDASSSGVKAITISQTLTDNTLYWTAITIDENGGSVTMSTYASPPTWRALSSHILYTGWTQTGVDPASSLPSTLSSPSVSTSALMEVSFGSN